MPVAHAVVAAAAGSPILAALSSVAMAAVAAMLHCVAEVVGLC